MIEEVKYTIRVPSEYVDEPKTKYAITYKSQKFEFNTQTEAERFEKFIASEKELEKWPQYEIGDIVYFWIQNELVFDKFCNLWKLTNRHFFGYNFTNWCPSQKPNSFPTLLYHYFLGNLNGRDDNEFRFTDPNDLLKWLNEQLDKRSIKNERR